MQQEEPTSLPREQVSQAKLGGRKEDDAAQGAQDSTSLAAQVPFLHFGQAFYTLPCLIIAKTQPGNNKPCVPDVKT